MRRDRENGGTNGGWAQRLRLVRQLLTETYFDVLVGGGLGLVDCIARSLLLVTFCRAILPTRPMRYQLDFGLSCCFTLKEFSVINRSRLWSMPAFSKRDDLTGS